MNYAIITSTQDPASMNIREFLLPSFKESDEEFEGTKVFVMEGAKLYLTNQKLVEAEGIDDQVDGDFVIFASKHRSAAGVPALTVHATGNWDKPEFGGEEKKLSVAAANHMSFVLKYLLSLNLDYQIDQEATHHGPLMKKPSMFVEIGSSEEQWENKEFGKIIADVILKVVNDEIPKKKTSIVLGGGHYCRISQKLKDYSVGHICPKYHLEKLDEELIDELISKNDNKVDLVILDWKGLGTAKQHVVDMLKKMKIPFERYQRLKKL